MERCKYHGDLPYKVKGCKTCGEPPVRSSDIVRRLPGHKLADILVKHGVIDPCAVEDPEGYDGGNTMARVAGVAQELCLMLASNAEVSDSRREKP